MSRPPLDLIPKARLSVYTQSPYTVERRKPTYVLEMYFAEHMRLLIVELSRHRSLLVLDLYPTPMRTTGIASRLEMPEVGLVSIELKVHASLRGLPIERIEIVSLCEDNRCEAISARMVIEDDVDSIREALTYDLLDELYHMLYQVIEGEARIQ